MAEAVLYVLKSVEIYGFRGQKKNISIRFDRNANFIIGRNGAGKTTLINLINSALNSDVVTLRKIPFEKMVIKFRSDKGNFVPTLLIENSIKDDSRLILYKIREHSKTSWKEFMLFRSSPRQFRFAGSARMHQPEYMYMEDRRDRIDLNRQLASLFNVTWLSLRRKQIEIEEDDDEDFMPYVSNVGTSEVDQHLSNVFERLAAYFSRLDRVAAAANANFQKQWFTALLTPMRARDHRYINEINVDKERENIIDIMRSFEVRSDDISDLLSSHFSMVQKLKEKENTQTYTGFGEISTLVNAIRLHSLVEKWQILQRNLDKIYLPKLSLSKVASEMLFRKFMEIGKNNQIFIKNMNSDEIELGDLSSGEKQILIFMGETVLQEGKSHIFLADEPELSLHVDWQEKLVPALLELNSSAQVVFATHSPDIVGTFQNNLHKMEDMIDDI